MRNTARQTRENRTITVDFRDEATYFHLIADGKAFLECVLAFLLALGFQLKHKATCSGGGTFTRHSHYVRVRLNGVPIWRLQCKHGHDPLYAGGEFRRLACTFPQAVTCDGPCGRNSRRIRSVFGLLC